VKWTALAFLAAAACSGKKEGKSFGPRFFSSEPTGVLCSKGVDAAHEWKHDLLQASLEHARDAGVVLQTYGHAPTIKLDEYAADFDWAQGHGVPSVTWRELAAGHVGAGWAFTVDDDEVDTWYGWREFLRAHHVKVTFFVTRFDRFTAEQKKKLHELVADGHDVEAHGKAHENAVDYVKAHGLEAYVRDEVLPSKQVLIDDGFPIIAFAYPYGAHTKEIDAALAASFSLIRTTGGEWCLK